MKKLPKLNPSQIFVLECAKKGVIKGKHITIYTARGPIVGQTFFAIDAKVDGQIKSLRQRRLIRVDRRNLIVSITPKGLEELNKTKELCSE